jgi:glucose-6-phosphate isomerase
MTILKETKQTNTAFSHYKATQKLRQLALNPYDLTKDGNLSPQRIAKFRAESCGYKFLYATERVDDETMRALVALAEESQALQKMEHMQAGEIMNYITGYDSDNRSVLHTALRDFFEYPNQGTRAIEAAKLARAEIEKIKAFNQKLNEEKRFTDLIVISIGGSDLGPKAQYLALRHLKKPDRHVHFISNIDPDDASLALRNLDLKNTLVLVVSKSGSTLETATNEELVRRRFVEAGVKPEDHFISITAQGSVIDTPSKYLEVFHIWDWVGGRFSSSSAVSGLLLSFAFGFDVYWEYLRGANAMDKAALNTDFKNNIPLLGALLGIWNRNFLGYTNLAVVPYSSALGRYAAHIQQVDMESNGKRIDQHGLAADFDTGPIVIGEPGTAAQHSFFQLLHQGTTIVPMEFIGFQRSQIGEDVEVDGTTSQEKLNANLFAQVLALATGHHSNNPNKEFPGNRPSHILLAKKLTPYALGSLLAYYEHKIAFQGFIWDINSFDQEGVQLGKVLANKILERISSSRRKTESKPFPAGDEFLNQLQSL